MIQVNEKWRISMDDRNAVLQESYAGKGANEGEVMWENAGYYPSFQAALVGLVKREVAVPGDLVEMGQRLDQIESDIRALSDDIFLGHR